MRIIYLFLFLPLLSASQKKDSTFNLIAGFDLKRSIDDVTIKYQMDGEYISDAVARTNGHFEYSRKLKSKAIATLYVRYSPMENEEIRILLEPGTMILTAKDSASNFTIIGSRMQRDFGELVRMLMPYDKAKKKILYSIAFSQMRKDTVLENQLEASLVALDTTMRKDTYRAFIRSHPHSNASMIALAEFYSNETDPYETESLFNSLSASLRTSEEGEAWRKRIETAMLTAIGRIAPDFSQPDRNGRQISLQSFRGKYVLLDLWASWCMPCRRENPYLVSAYKKYKKKGFEIFSISLDDKDSRAAWLEAIKKDGLKWTHASDLEGWENGTAALYQVESIPFNVLIDPEGRIVAKNLRGEDLERKLAELIR